MFRPSFETLENRVVFSASPLHVVGQMADVPTVLSSRSEVAIESLAAVAGRPLTQFAGDGLGSSHSLQGMGTTHRPGGVVADWPDHGRTPEYVRREAAFGELGMNGGDDRWNAPNRDQIIAILIGL